MNIAIYSRKSKYSEKGESIDNQIQFCKEYAAMHFKHIPDLNFIVYEDEGFSAATTIRPQFQKLIQDIKEHKIQMLLCYRLDRINRNVSDFSNTLDLLERYTVSFVSATENFDTTTPMGKAMIYIASVFAQLERETTAERVRDNMLALSRTGRWLGGMTPMGYTSEAILYLDEEMKERQLYKLVPKEDELNRIKQIFNKYMELKSLSQVEHYCLTNFIKTQKGYDFTKNTLSIILQNPTYCIADSSAFDYFQDLGCVLANDKDEFDGKNGILCYNRTKHQTGKNQKKRQPKEWIIAIGKHEGIISGEDFSKIQNLIKFNKEKATPRSDTSSFALLSGKIICTKCGSKLRVKNIRKTENSISFCYACEMKMLSKSTRCNIKNIPGKKLDSLLLHTINILIGSDIKTTDYIPFLRKKEKVILEADLMTKERVEFFNKESIYLNQSIQKLMSQLVNADSNLAEKYLLPQIKDLDNKLNALQTNIASLSKISNSDLTEDNELNIKFNNLVHTRMLIEFSDLTQKKNLLNDFIEAIEWDGKDISITLKTHPDARI